MRQPLEALPRGVQELIRLFRWVFALTFVEKVVAAVLNARLAVFGGNEASEGGEPGGEEDGELDHFDEVVLGSR